MKPEGCPGCGSTAPFHNAFNCEVPPEVPDQVEALAGELAQVQAAGRDQARQAIVARVIAAPDNAHVSKRELLGLNKPRRAGSTPLFDQADQPRLF